MAHQPILRPYPPGPPDPDDEPLFATQTETAGEADLDKLVQTLAAHGGGEVSPDIALDLVLNQIVEQARLATTATGAAIALMREDELICRASGGINAPELGVRLNTRSGMSGACVTTRQVQKCDDTEMDLRADALALQQLGIRSVLVVPVVEDEQLIGVFEIFAPRPNAFSDRDVQTLEALSRRITFNVNRAANSTVAKPVLVTPPEAAAEPEIAPEAAKEVAETVPKVRRAHDPWTETLNAVVIALALLLGWIVGREGWHRATHVSKAHAVQASSIPVAPTAAPIAVKQEPAAHPGSPAVPLAPPLSPAAKKVKLIKNDPAANGGLVVYEKGRVVYQWSPKASTARTTAPVFLSPEVASTYIVQRFEPAYPESAKQQGVEGSVVLDAVVGTDGTVRELKDVSGDQQLAAAAVDAVKRWQFKPYEREGVPVEFRTLITLNFALPKR